MPLPRQFREQLKRGKGGIITEGDKRYIEIYSQVSWDKYIKELTSKKRRPDDQRILARAVFYNVFPLRTDGQGRIALSSEQCEYAGIIDSAIVLGCGNHIEIWNEELGKTAISEAREKKPQLENMYWERE